MAKQVKQRRDTAANIALAVPAAGELAMNLTNNRIHLGNGILNGGMAHANRLDMVANPWNSGTTSGTNTMTMSLLVPLLAYVAGQQFDVKIGTTNTGAATLNIDSLGALSIKKRDGTGALVDVASGDLRSGNIYQLWYDGTVLQILGGLAAARSNEEVISSLSASSSSQLDFALSNPSQYDYYRLDIEYWEASNGHAFRLSQGGGYLTGSVYSGQGWYLARGANNAAAPAFTGFATSTNMLDPANAGGTRLSGRVYVHHKRLTTNRPWIEAHLSSSFDNAASGQPQYSYMTGNTTTAADIDGIRMLATSGTMARGRATLVGVKNV